MLEIFVTGTTGVGKSLYAEAVLRSAERDGVSVSCSDHELFTSHDNYAKLLADVRSKHKKSDADLSIIVVNDGERRLSVTYADHVPYDLAKTLFPDVTR